MLIGTTDCTVQTLLTLLTHYNINNSYALILDTHCLKISAFTSSYDLIQQPVSSCSKLTLKWHVFVFETNEYRKTFTQFMWNKSRCTSPYTANISLRAGMAIPPREHLYKEQRVIHQLCEWSHRVYTTRVHRCNMVLNLHATKQQWYNIWLVKIRQLRTCLLLVSSILISPSVAKNVVYQPYLG